MNNLEIVPARPEDVPVIFSLIKALADYERMSDQVVATEADLRRWLFGARPAADVVLARAADRVVGFALFFHNFSTFLGRPGLWLEDLFVRPTFRRQGCALILLRTLAGIARERGCGRFEWAVLDWNTPAIRFYESLGATVLPDWRIARVVGPALESLADRPDGSPAT